MGTSPQQVVGAVTRGVTHEMVIEVGSFPCAMWIWVTNRGCSPSNVRCTPLPLVVTSAWVWYPLTVRNRREENNDRTTKLVPEITKFILVCGQFITGLFQYANPLIPKADNVNKSVQ
jgi:hypothetical protein